MKFLITVLVYWSLSGCSHFRTQEEIAAHPEEAPPVTQNMPKKAVPSIEAKEVAAEEQAVGVAEMKFLKGRAELNPSNVKILKDMIEQTRKKGALSEVKIASWSDQEYPSDSKHKLSEKDLHLAKNRNKYVKGLIESWGVRAAVTSVNMASRPSMFEQVFGGNKVEMKKAFEAAGIHSKASKAIVMVRVNQKKPL